MFRKYKIILINNLNLKICEYIFYCEIFILNLHILYNIHILKVS